ncbi:MAG TPA: hypothetical protein VGE52_19605 [Pirellulales bacterium]
MSRFDDLCDALRKMKGELYEYRDFCYSVATKIFQGLEDYLEPPQGCLSYFCTMGTYAGKKVPGLSMAMQLGDDAFWEFGIVVDLVEDPGMMPTEPLTYKLKMKRLGEVVELRIVEGPTFSFPVNADDFSSVHEFLYQDLHRKVQYALVDFLATGDPARRIGF